MTGIQFDDFKICDSLKIDEHHRHVSSILAKNEPGKAISSKTSATIQYDWAKIFRCRNITVKKITRLPENKAHFS